MLERADAASNLLPRCVQVLGFAAHPRLAGTFVQTQGAPLPVCPTSQNQTVHALDIIAQHEMGWCA